MKSIYIAVKRETEEPVAALTRVELAGKIGVHRNSIKTKEGRGRAKGWYIYIVPLRENNSNMNRDNWKINFKQK